MSEVRIDVLDGLDAIDGPSWSQLLERGGAGSVFMTYGWQQAWWASFERGHLLLISAGHNGRLVAVAPLFADEGMVFFVGSGGSDYLDFVGDVSDPQVLTAILREARARTPDFAGFRFYHVRDDSPTGEMLRQVAPQLQLECYDEGDLSAPYLDAASGDEALLGASRKKSLLRAERYFEREGDLAVEHLRRADEVLPHLPTYFEQHVARWADTPFPSLFLDSAQRDFYQQLAKYGAEEGWLRFTRVVWEGRPIAFHFGSSYAGSYLWYKPSFDIELARRSPGEVLMRHLLLAAEEEGAQEFDLGLGDESFKERFANRIRKVRTWGLYPTS